MRPFYFISIGVIALILVNGCQHASDSIHGAEIVDYGIYQLVEGERAEAAESVTGYSRLVIDKTLVRETDQVPLERGVSFGFRYLLKGDREGERVPVTVAVHHPKLKNPVTGRELTVSRGEDGAIVGAINFHAGWVFEEEWAIAPGEWRIEVLYRGQKLAEKVFTVGGGDAHPSMPLASG